MDNLPKFIDDLTDEVQPITVQAQDGEYIAVIQWDGTGEFQHWILAEVRRAERERVAKMVRDCMLKIGQSSPYRDCMLKIGQSSPYRDCMLKIGQSSPYRELVSELLDAIRAME